MPAAAAANAIASPAAVHVRQGPSQVNASIQAQTINAEIMAAAAASSAASVRFINTETASLASSPAISAYASRCRRAAGIRRESDQLNLHPACQQQVSGARR